MQKYYQELTPLYREEHREAMFALFDWLKERRAEYDKLYQDTKDVEYYNTFIRYNTIIGDIANGFAEYCDEQEGL